MATHVLRLSIASLICCITLPLANAAEEAVAPAQIDEWILQLDDNLYATRKGAQEKLEESGQPALVAVKQEALAGTLESSTRALNIMLSWTESKDHDLQIASLNELVTLPNRPIEAGLASELLADAHEQAALEAFVAFGGTFDTKAPGMPVVPNYRLPNLRLIINLEWKGEAEGLKHLVAIRRATAISFYSAPLGDEILEYLPRLPNVQRIELYGTNVSKTKTELENQFPQIYFDVRSGALLGIHGQAHLQGPVLIEAVAKNSAAEKAGLLRQDFITELNGEAIQNFPDLVEQIKEFNAGDSVELTILRGGELIKKNVTFDRWGEQAQTDQNAQNQMPRNLPPNQAPRGFPGRQAVPGSPSIILDRR